MAREARLRWLRNCWEVRRLFYMPLECGSQVHPDKVLSRRSKVAVSVISIIAGSMVIGDGALTPAISVLSAMEGLEVYR